MPGIGTIITRSYTSDAQLPVSGVGISFYQRSAVGGRTLLAVRISDESGRTTPVRIGAPSRSESQSPKPQATTAWADVDIVATHRDYGRIEMEHVQIFPDIVTVQDLRFIPTAEGGPLPGETEYYDTSPQPLY